MVVEFRHLQWASELLGPDAVVLLEAFPAEAGGLANAGMREFMSPTDAFADCVQDMMRERVRLRVKLLISEHCEFAVLVYGNIRMHCITASM
eukprot:COSAG02_NODE_3793_length_6224_cov_6.876408_2_plen_92_part_00